MYKIPVYRKNDAPGFSVYIKNNHLKSEKPSETILYKIYKTIIRNKAAILPHI